MNFIVFIGTIGVDCVSFGSDKEFVRGHVSRPCALKVPIIGNNLEVVLKLGSVNIKVSLIRLVSDGITDFGSEHHLIALHEIVHGVL
jgi:hypothetical protein